MSDAREVMLAERLSGDQPWNQRKVDELGPSIMKFMEDHEPFYKKWAETWFNNFQFIYGNQSVRWSKRYGYSVDSDFLSRQPAMNQRAQTNVSRVIAEALSSMMYANLPEWNVEASEASSVKGKRFKRIIQKVLDCYTTKLCMDVELANAAMIYTVFGDFKAQIDWNRTGGQIMEIPKYQKRQAGVFTDWMAQNPMAANTLNVPVQSVNGMGQPSFEERWEPVLDQMGRQIVDKMFAGDVRINICTPLEVRRGIDSSGMHNTKYVERILLLDYDEYLDRYGSLPGKTKYWAKVQPIYSNPSVYRLAMRHFMRMQFTTPPGMNDMFGRSESVYRNTLFRNKVLVVEHYDKPHPIKWPLGRKVIVCNGDATHVTIPDYNTGKLDGWHPFVEAQWLTIPPSSLSAGPMNDVVSKNKELNILDSLEATMTRRNMGSQLLIKSGSGVDPQRFTGEPGMVHEVPDPYGMRWLHDDMPIPPVLAELRKAKKEDCYEVSGAGDALRGDRSKGAPSGYAQRIIQEREEARLAPARKKFEKGCSGIGEKLFICLKNNVVQLGDDVMGYLTRQAAGEFQPDDVIALLGSNIAYGVDITVESDSMHLHSKATQQATVNDMAQGNKAVQDRLAQNPGVLDQFLKFFDADELRDKSAAHRDRAQRENEQFSDLLNLGPEALGGGQCVVIYQDDDSIHMDEHTDFFVKNADQITRNPQFMDAFLLHIEQHRYQASQKQGDMMQGTSLQLPGMMQQVKQTPPPGMPQVQQGAMLKQQEQAQQAQQPQPQGGGSTPPQGPKQPAMIGSGGGKQTGGATPAANTAPAMQQQMKGGMPK